jgi:DNA polymerase-4
MHYIAHLAISAFYCDVLERGRADYTEAPLVVYRDKRVLDANTIALAKGVAIGMTLPEAKAVLNGEGNLVEWKEEEFRTKQTQWLETCAQFTDTIEPLDQHEALLDLSGHPDPHSILNRLQTELQNKAKVGLAGTRWVAKLACYLGDPLGIAITTPKRFLKHVPTMLMDTVPEEHRRRLFFLGYRSVGDIRTLDITTLRAQFGNEAFEIARAAHGGGDPTVLPLFPPDSLAARFTFDGPPDNWEMLHNGFAELAQEVGKKLQEKDLVGRELNLFLEHDEGRVTPIKRVFTKPIDSPAALYSSLKLTLYKTPEEEVIGMRVRLPGLEKRSRVQLQLDGARSRSDRDTSAVAALQKVKAVFGDTAVQMGNELNEQRRALVLRAWSKINGWH